MSSPSSKQNLSGPPIMAQISKRERHSIEDPDTPTTKADVATTTRFSVLTGISNTGNLHITFSAMTIPPISHGPDFSWKLRELLRQHVKRDLGDEDDEGLDMPKLQVRIHKILVLWGPTVLPSKTSAGEIHSLGQTNLLDLSAEEFQETMELMAARGWKDILMVECTLIKDDVKVKPLGDVWGFRPLDLKAIVDK